MSVGTHAIELRGIVKRYGPAVALDGLDLAVPAGSVCGLLGPNGAGKTTAVRILATLLRFDVGQATVAGCDLARQSSAVRERIGLLGQYAAIDEILSGRQNLELFGRLYHLGAAAARRRADELLEQFGLQDAGSRPVAQYSGGMRRRIDLAVSLIMAPTVLLLDEPTTGLDPRGRGEVWAAVRRLVAAGTTVLLTTQYLEEADQLADTIALIDHGRIVAEGSPAQLKATVGGDRIELVLATAADIPAAAALLEHVCGDAVNVDSERQRIGGPAPERGQTLIAAVRALDQAGIAVEDIALRRPTLDEVFLALTGQPVGSVEEQPV